MRLKTYDIARSGSASVGRITATCITKAAQKWIATLDKPATYELISREQARIVYTDNHTMCSDYIITLV